MASFLKQRQKAYKKLSEKGEPVTFSIDKYEYTPGVGNTTTETILVEGYGITPNINNDDNSSTKNVDSKMSFSTLSDVELEIGMECDWFGEVFSILKINKKAPTGDVIIYFLDLEKK